MSEVTRLLDAATAGDRKAAADLLPLVYDELRKLAATRMVNEKPGHTLDSTALVHEAYLRLLGDQHFEGRNHFFAAAAEAMRHILVDSARRKGRIKRGGPMQRLDLDSLELAAEAQPDELLAVHEALEEFSRYDPEKAELVKLRFFGGLTLPAAAMAMGWSLATAKRHWAFARAWLYQRIAGDR